MSFEDIDLNSLEISLKKKCQIQIALESPHPLYSLSFHINARNKL